MAKNDDINYNLTLKDLFSRKMNEAIGKVDAMDKKLDKLSLKGKQASSIFSGLGSKIAGAFSVAAVVSFGKQVVDSLAKYEVFLASIKSMLGGNAGAAEALNAQLVQLAKTTPFSLEDVRNASKQLLAYGYQAGEVTENMKMLGNISSGVGAPIGDIVYLMGTLKVQNRAFTKDLYQFQGRGINVVKELAKQFKVTESAIMTMAKEGKISFADVQKSFQAMTREGGLFFNLMAEQSKTVGGQISNLSDAWEQLQTEIGKSQRGIIAGTLSFMNELVSAMAHGAEMDNFRDKVNSKLDPRSRVNETTWYNPLSWFGGGEEKDERHVATNKNGGRRMFRNNFEKQNFLGSQDGEGWNDNGTVDTETRLLEFQDKWVSKLESVAAKPTALNLATLKSELLNEKVGIRKEQIAGTISSPLGRSEIATLEEALTRLNDISKLNKIEAVKPGKDEEKKKDDLGSGIDTSMHRPQNLYISITSLIEQLTISTQNLNDSTSKIKEEVTKVLIEAVNDVNYIDGK